MTERPWVAPNVGVGDKEKEIIASEGKSLEDMQDDLCLICGQRVKFLNFGSHATFRHSAE